MEKKENLTQSTKYKCYWTNTSCYSTDRFSYIELLKTGVCLWSPKDIMCCDPEGRIYRWIDAGLIGRWLDGCIISSWLRIEHVEIPPTVARLCERSKASSTGEVTDETMKKDKRNQFKFCYMLLVDCVAVRMRLCCIYWQILTTW